ncbi:hypothetical protein FD755_002352 [Muntiacus reevesi]|uniref:PX domain-containing protein n=1 Tax=Muntiacus reevesi TaxID=9886 RepID=A0A5J5N4E1_MUNRE|nr:hypothetical protein FD755_002352 [Muntiacus reevesi]
MCVCVYLFITNFLHQSTPLDNYVYTRYMQFDLTFGTVSTWYPAVLPPRQHLMYRKCSAVILENEELPKLFLDFLNVRHLPSLPKTESCGSFDETESEESSKLSHQPVLLFLRDPYVLPAASGNQTCHLLTALY